MLTHFARTHRHTALVIVSVLSLAALGACASSTAPNQPHRAAPTDGGIVRQAAPALPPSDLH